MLVYANSHADGLSFKALHMIAILRSTDPVLKDRVSLYAAQPPSNQYNRTLSECDLIMFGYWAVNLGFR